MRRFPHIAKLVKDKRLNHPQKFSQAELSEALGYKNGQFISNVERSLCSVPLKMLGKIGDVLNIAPDEIKEAMMKDYNLLLDDSLSQSKVVSASEVSQVNGSGNYANGKSYV